MEARVTLTSFVCGGCGGVYALAESYQDHKSEGGGQWNCPYCKEPWGYFEDTENDQLKKKLQAALEREAELQDALRVATTKSREEQCPQCDKSYKRLSVHIKHAHPETLTKKEENNEEQNEEG